MPSLGNHQGRRGPPRAALKKGRRRSLPCRPVLARCFWPLAIGGAAILAGCAQDSCRSYSEFTCAELEQQTYNVFYTDAARATGEPRSLHVGQVVGLQACGTLAHSTAQLQETQRAGDWSYVCCLHQGSSMCVEKHR